MKAPNAIISLAIIVAAAGGWVVIQRGAHMMNSAGHDDLSPAAQMVSHAPEVLVPQPRWAVDPTEPGSNLPPAGRSLFDFIVAAQRDGKPVYDIPFPFEALIRRVEERAGCAAPGESCTRQVLIPLGRSLQRTAASPDFFSFPRVVVAVDREGPARVKSGMLLKDRLYLGYQEKSNLLEVISYNELAGRFEFQLVKDYRPGGSPQIVYANRNVCAACHQNLAPLFSRQQWDETNANPQIAALLERAKPSFYGFPARRGMEVPNAIDGAIHRANMLSVYQLLWKDGCGMQEHNAQRCRAAALTAALQYGLSGERGFDAGASEFREAVVAPLRKTAASNWPLGLAIPNSEIPNRDAMAFRAGANLGMSNVAARFEPLAPRAPLEIWPADDQMANYLVAGLTQFFSSSDLQNLDRQLRLMATRNGPALRTYAARCEVSTPGDEVRFRCRSAEGTPGTTFDGRVTLRGGWVESGSINALAVGGAAPLRLLEIAQGRLLRKGSASTLRLIPSIGERSARLQDGNGIESVELRWQGDGSAEAAMVVLEDFAPVRAALTAMAAAGSAQSPALAAPFARALAMPALANAVGSPQRDWCCANANELPAAEEDAEMPHSDAVSAAVALFMRPCGACHRTPQRFPANFLAGDGKRVEAALASCASRIFVRLSMWQVSADQRAKTPMPPPRAAHEGTPSEHEDEPRAAIASLKNAAAQMLLAQTGRTPSLDELLSDGYESLRPCLPAGS